MKIRKEEKTMEEYNGRKKKKGEWRKQKIKKKTMGDQFHL